MRVGDRGALPCRTLQVPRSAFPATRFVFMHPHADLCMKDPGHPVDVVIAADLETFTRTWMGYLGLADSQVRRQ